MKLMAFKWISNNKWLLYKKASVIEPDKQINMLYEATKIFQNLTEKLAKSHCI